MNNESLSARPAKEMLEALFLTDAKWRGDVRGVPQPEVAGGPSVVNPLRRAEAAGVCVVAGGPRFACKSGMDVG